MAEQFPGPVLDLLDAAGGRTVFEHGGEEVSGARLLGMVRRAVRGLGKHGVGPGDGVAMLLGVGPGAFAAIIAAHVVGARVVGVRPGLTGPQQEHLLRDVAVRVTDRFDDSAAHGAGLVLALDDLLSAPDGGERPRVRARPGDVARLLHTSGSTGLPKACVQTYAAMTAGWAHRPEAWPPAVRELAGRLDRFLVFGTLASQVMMEYGLLALAAGGTLVTADPPVLPDALVRYRATASVITVARLTKLVASQRASPVDLGNERVTPRLSVGAAIARAGDEPEALLRRADAEMYVAKRATTAAA